MGFGEIGELGREIRKDEVKEKKKDREKRFFNKWSQKLIELHEVAF